MHVRMIRWWRATGCCAMLAMKHVVSGTSWALSAACLASSAWVSHASWGEHTARNVATLDIRNAVYPRVKNSLLPHVVSTELIPPQIIYLR